MFEEIAVDTSVLVPHFRNDPGIVERLDRYEKVSIPIFVVGEMAVGFSLAETRVDAKKSFETFLSDANVLECTREVADKYGEITATLRRAGAMIPPNDVWIAACCIVHDKILATRDAHFQRVAGLKTEMW